MLEIFSGSEKPGPLNFFICWFWRFLFLHLFEISNWYIFFFLAVFSYFRFCYLNCILKYKAADSKGKNVDFTLEDWWPDRCLKFTRFIRRRWYDRCVVSLKLHSQALFLWRLRYISPFHFLFLNLIIFYRDLIDCVTREFYTMFLY